MKTSLFRAGECVAALAISLGIVELALREYDSWHGGTHATNAASIAARPIDRARLDRYVAGRVYPVGIDPLWFWKDPAPVVVHPLTADLQQRHERYPTDPYAAFFEWNLNYLRQQACAGPLPDVLTTVSDYYYFSPADQSLYPTYRHTRFASPPGWFTSNSFGWRGPEIALNKPPQTIRIAFVGASTTISAYDAPYSHPEMIEHWLNLWSAGRGWPYHFEAINAGRTGIDSHSIAAIVRQELLPVEPDMVVYYEGANQFWPADHIRYRFGRLYPKPRVTFQTRYGENHSAIFRHAWAAVDRWTGGDGREPVKPPQRVEWPVNVDELNPDPHNPNLPVHLPTIVADLDAVRSDLAGIGSELALSSFIWMVEDGLRLDPAKDAGLFRYLNQTFWPISYVNMRRFADFQNRVFERYAQLHHVPFLDVSREFPHDPGLFADAIHLRDEGLRLQAWLYLNELAPLLEEQIRAGMLPRASRQHREVHPAFDQPRRTITLNELRSQCATAESTVDHVRH